MEKSIDIKLKCWAIKAEGQAMTIATIPNTGHPVSLRLDMHLC